MSCCSHSNLVVLFYVLLEVSRTSPSNMARTSPKDLFWPSRRRPDLTSQGRPNLTSWRRPEMASRGRPLKADSRRPQDVLRTSARGSSEYSNLDIPKFFFNFSFRTDSIDQIYLKAFQRSRCIENPVKLLRWSIFCKIS